ncbi:putative Heat shock protein DnaJ, cysteine-rich [Lupinus albus]|uniref:Putative Heat shock protein DnaJ, cysteine-rich n=1 Tax=Lupinus albus TaxID=3870 RepID=A0A6A4N0Y0_LUPAL|nr:putative Heat shock protein DnaJ, cysteine-rich [Lupinus albus]
MDSLTLQMATSQLVFSPNASTVASLNNKNINFRSNFKGGIITKIHVVSPNGSASCNVSKAIREEIIEKPVGLSLAEKVIGNNHRCADCQAKGAVLCATCAGSGLYIDSILESQGIIVKVRCLGCGGTGNMMCTECGGRGHLGLK